jgi:hypothetical protein
LSGCGIIAKALRSKPKPDEDAKKPHDLFIGVIDMVNPEQHFVLIKTGVQLKLQPGWKLETRPSSGGPKSVLAITPEQKLNFLSADIVEGFPQQGEMVVLPPQGGSAAAASVPGSPGAAAAPALPSGGGFTPGQLSPQQPSLPVQSPQPRQAPQIQQSAKPIIAPNGEVLPPAIR